ncbi:MAG TPA: LysE family translocator, partial [Bradyrhizobium sp.]|nr:LysE family translocator [Bradyrhizobium sp.]
LELGSELRPPEGGACIFALPASSPLRRCTAGPGQKIAKTTPCKVAWWSPAGCFGPIGTKRAFREGVLVEALNPKTAAFFLAFIPQFLEPAAGNPALQFMALGLISVTLNTFADVIVVVAASTARTNLVHRPRLVQRLRQGSGLFIAGLGVSLALARRPATS